MFTGHLYIFFGEMSILVVCVFLNYFLIYSGYQVLILYMIYKFFFTFHGLPFHSVVSVLWYTNILNFIEVQFYLVFFFYFPFFCCHIQEIIVKSNVMKLFLCIFLWKFYGVSSLALKFRSLIYFELIFCTWCKLRVKLHSSACRFPVCPAPFVKDSSFPNEWSYRLHQNVICRVPVMTELVMNPTSIHEDAGSIPWPGSMG